MRTSLNRFRILQLDRVPKLDRSVLSAATSREQTLLMRRPRDRFDCSLVLVEFSQWLRAASGTPKHKLIIIATGCQLLVIPTPFKATDFLTVTGQLCCEVLRTTQVAIKDAVVTASGTQEGIVPCDCTDTTLVTT